MYLSYNYKTKIKSESFSKLKVSLSMPILSQSLYSWFIHFINQFGKQNTVQIPRKSLLGKKVPVLFIIFLSINRKTWLLLADNTISSHLNIPPSMTCNTTRICNHCDSLHWIEYLAAILAYLDVLSEDLVSKSSPQSLVWCWNYLKSIITQFCCDHLLAHAQTSVWLVTN